MFDSKLCIAYIDNKHKVRLVELLAFVLICAAGILSLANLR